MSNDSNTKDPRIEAGAKAWDKHMGGRYAPNEVEELSEEVAVILAAADAADSRKPHTITTVEELDGLAKGTTILDAGGMGAQWDGEMWSGEGRWWHSTQIALPATVLHEPAAEATH